ncbi:MAG: hypothetical protein CMH50_07510 [Myxococcales bacterium]|nr:hypothetical protein [Myxococcales bacterium]
MTVPQAQISQTRTEAGQGRRETGEKGPQKQPFVSGVGWLDPELQQKIDRGEDVGRRPRTARVFRTRMPMPGVLAMGNWRTLVGWQDRPLEDVRSSPEPTENTLQARDGSDRQYLRQAESLHQSALSEPSISSDLARGGMAQHEAKPVSSGHSNGGSSWNRHQAVESSPSPEPEVIAPPTSSIAKRFPTPLETTDAPTTDPAESREQTETSSRDLGLQPSRVSESGAERAHADGTGGTGHTLIGQESVISSGDQDATQRGHLPVDREVKSTFEHPVSQPETVAASAEGSGEHRDVEMRPQSVESERVAVSLTPQVLASKPTFYRTEVKPEHGFEQREMYVLQRMIGRFTLDQLVAMRLGMEGDELGQLLARASHCGVLTGLPPGSVPEMTASNPPEPELDPPVQAPVETVEVAHRESEETQASFQRIPESQVPAPVESVEVVHREPEETPKELPDTLEAQIPSPMESVEVAYREPEERSEPLSVASEPAALRLEQRSSAVESQSQPQDVPTEQIPGSAIPMFHRDRFRPDQGFSPGETYVMQRMIGRFTLDQLIAMRLGLSESEVQDLVHRASALGVVTFD